MSSEATINDDSATLKGRVKASRVADRIGHNGLTQFFGRHFVRTETANKDGTWLREISSFCCLTTTGKTRQLLLN